MDTVKVLLIDDEERFLATTKTLLDKRGVKTFTASNGVFALKLLEDNAIDVVVLDVKMPGLDGIEVLRKIKQRFPLVEVLMLTGHASVKSAVEGLRLGAFDYLVKPCDVSDLLDKINEAHEKRAAVEAKIQKAKIEDIISHPLAVFDKKNN